MTRDGAGGRGRLVLAVAWPLVAAAFVVAYRQVLGIALRPRWPPPAGAVTAAGAERATEAFAARDGVRPRDAALDFAWSTAATIDPHVEGASFFPRILADVDEARSSVDILTFGWREGERGRAPWRGRADRRLRDLEQRGGVGCPQAPVSTATRRS